MPRLSLDLTPEQQAEAARIKQQLRATVDDELPGIAEPLASKPDGQLLGPTALQVRDRVLKIGAKAIETALNERNKGATKVPAPAAPAVADPASSSAAATGPSSV
ncbi:MAG TPA: hypothetical protein VKP69_31695 [Isosphaeraceae bacterium]|nr:hypothetical protein [Isosphaeraceae bacterium]